MFSSLDFLIPLPAFDAVPLELFLPLDFMFEIWMAAQVIAENFAIEQIENWRQIEFLVVHFEFSNICDPFSI